MNKLAPAVAPLLALIILTAAGGQTAQDEPAAPPTSRPAVEAVGPKSILLIEIQEFRGLSVPARMLREVEADGAVGIGMGIRVEAEGKTPRQIREAIAAGLEREGVMPGGKAFLTVSHWREPGRSPFEAATLLPGDFVEVDQTMTGLLPSGRTVVRIAGDGQIMLPLLEQTIDTDGLSISELELLYGEGLVDERIARREVADAVLLRRLSRDEAEGLLNLQRSLETHSGI